MNRTVLGPFAGMTKCGSFRGRPAVPGRGFNIFVSLALLALAPPQAQAQEPVRIRFEGAGDEEGVTEFGATSFRFKGSSWSGGTVWSFNDPSLYSSPRFSYILGASGATVSFDRPATGINFFFGGLVTSSTGIAKAFDKNGSLVGTVATGGIVSFDTATPIAKVTVSAGAIDDFGFTLPPVPSGQFDFSAVEGNWLDPNTDRQGLTFDFVPASNLLVAAWFTYTAAPVLPLVPPPSEIGGPGQAWMVANLAIDGNTATGDLVVHEGGAFDQPPTAFIRARTVGSMSIEFTACDAGTVSYQIDDPPLTSQFPIVPLEKFVNPKGFSCGSP